MSGEGDLCTSQWCSKAFGHTRARTVSVGRWVDGT